MTDPTERAMKILGSVCIRDTEVLVALAEKNKRQLSDAEREGALGRARRYGVYDKVQSLLT